MKSPADKERVMQQNKVKEKTKKSENKGYTVYFEVCKKRSIGLSYFKL